MRNIIQISCPGNENNGGRPRLFCIPLTSIKYVESAQGSQRGGWCMIHFNDATESLYVDTAYEDIIRQLEEI